MLHSRESVRDVIDDDVFASSDLSVAQPKYRMPTDEQDPRHVLQIVRDELMLDGNSRQDPGGEIAKPGPFEIIYAGDGDGMAALCWKLRDGVDHGFTLFDLADLLLADHRRAMAHLDKHPLGTSMSADEASGFHH